MSGLNFELYQTPMSNQNTAYTQFQIGKGKKPNTSVYMDNHTFDCIKGVIWNKHREFSNQRKINQINRDDWQRVLKGFVEAIEQLKTSTDSKQLIDVLSMPNHLATQQENIFAQKLALQQFIKALVAWIEKNLQGEKYILIIQNNPS